MDLKEIDKFLDLSEQNTITILSSVLDKIDNIIKVGNKIFICENRIN
jgi:hypothetical protein